VKASAVQWKTVDVRPQFTEGPFSDLVAWAYFPDEHLEQGYTVNSWTECQSKEVIVFTAEQCAKWLAYMALLHNKYDIEWDTKDSTASVTLRETKEKHVIKGEDIIVDGETVHVYKLFRHFEVKPPLLRKHN